MRTPEPVLRSFVYRLDPKDQKLIRSVRAAGRKRFPTADQRAYDYSKPLRQRDVIARGVFTSVNDVARKLMRYIKRYHQQPKPIRWSYADPTRRILPHGSDSAVTGR